MTLIDELEILDDKIKANQAQYDLDRKAAQISALSSKELDKYEYLTGKELGYKSGVVEKVKFEYFPLGEALNKGLIKDKKDKKVIKYVNDLKYDSVHNFDKYCVSHFNEISSVDSKFDTLNKFYKIFLKSNDPKSKYENTNQKKITVTKNASLLYNELIDIYEKEYDQVFKSKDNNWRLKT